MGGVGRREGMGREGGMGKLIRCPEVVCNVLLKACLMASSGRLSVIWILQSECH